MIFSEQTKIRSSCSIWLTCELLAIPSVVIEFEVFVLEVVASRGQVLLIATLFRFVRPYAVGDAGVIVVE